MRLVDTHCHIDLPTFDEDRSAVIERARAAGVDRMIVIGFAPERWGSALRLAAEEPGVFVTVGLHPTDAGRWSDALENDLRETARNPAVRGIGEIGIDYHWKSASPEEQGWTFARQIALAKDLTLPFVIHQRDAERDVLEVLRVAGPPHAGVMHCFTGDAAYASECLDLGLHLGIGGAVTFRKARALHEVARDAPLDRIVLETDAPYMTPSPHRGQRNEPAHVRLIAERVAELRGVPLEEIAATTTANAERLFRLEPCGQRAGKPDAETDRAGG